MTAPPRPFNLKSAVAQFNAKKRSTKKVTSSISEAEEYSRSKGLEIPLEIMAKSIVGDLSMAERITPEFDELKMRHMVYSAKRLAAQSELQILEQASLKLFKALDMPDKSEPSDRPPVRVTRKKFELPEEWFEFEELYSDFSLKNAVIKEISDVEVKHRLYNISTFGDNDDILSESQLNSYPANQDSIGEIPHFFSEVDKRRVYKGFVRCYNWIRWFTSCPLAAFLTLVRKTSKVPVGIHTWRFPPNTQDYRLGGLWSPDHILYEWGCHFYSVPISSVEMLLDYSDSFSWIFKICIQAYRLTGDWPNFIDQQLYDDLMNLRRMKEEYSSDDLSAGPHIIEGELHPAQRTDWNDPPHYTLLDRMRNSDNFWRFYETGKSYNAKDIIVNSLYIQCMLVGPHSVYLSRRYPIQELSLASVEQREAPDAWALATLKDKLEEQVYSFKHQMLQELLDTMEIPVPQTGTSIEVYSLTAENDVFDDDDFGFDFATEEAEELTTETDRSMAREPEGSFFGMFDEDS